MLNLAPYNSAPPDLLLRARQLGSLVARVSPGTVGLSGFSQAAQLPQFYGAATSTVRELQGSRLPIWHPLPFQRSLTIPKAPGIPTNSSSATKC